MVLTNFILLLLLKVFSTGVDLSTEAGGRLREDPLIIYKLCVTSQHVGMRRTLLTLNGIFRDMNIIEILL